MAGRFLFQKLSTRMSRSTSLVGAHASDSTTVGDPVTRRAWEGSIRIHKHVPAAHVTTVAPNNSVIHGYEGGIRTLRYLFNGASAKRSAVVAPNFPGIHAARYFSTVPHTAGAFETGSLASGMLSVATLKSASVNSVGVKRTFSSSASTKNTISLKPKVRTSTAEWEAKFASDKAAMEADLAAWSAKMDVKIAAFVRYITFFVGSWCLIFWGWFSMMDSGSSHGDQSTYQVQSSPHCCSSCCKCQSTDRNPKTE